MKRNYNHESVGRALTVHQQRGAIRSAVAVFRGAEQSWRVDVPELGELELSLDQAYGLCVGLAAGERAYRPVPVLALDRALQVDASGHDDAWSRVNAIVEVVCSSTANGREVRA